MFLFVLNKLIHLFIKGTFYPGGYHPAAAAAPAWPRGVPARSPVGDPLYAAPPGHPILLNLNMP